jgi:hypothetical protein
VIVQTHYLQDGVNAIYLLPVVANYWQCTNDNNNIDTHNVDHCCLNNSVPNNVTFHPSLLEWMLLQQLFVRSRLRHLLNSTSTHSQHYTTTSYSQLSGEPCN